MVKVSAEPVMWNFLDQSVDAPICQSLSSRSPTVQYGSIPSFFFAERGTRERRLQSGTDGPRQVGECEGRSKLTGNLTIGPRSRVIGQDNKRRMMVPPPHVGTCRLQNNARCAEIGDYQVSNPAGIKVGERVIDPIDRDWMMVQVFHHTCHPDSDRRIGNRD
jgi:hypothetical protein